MKLANGSGSIVCLDKSGKKRRKPWAVRITTGWKDGKQVRKYVGYYATQQEALMGLAEYHKVGYDIDLSKLTLNEVFDKWYERMTQRGLSTSALGTHRLARARFGSLGDKPIKNIKNTHLQTWLDEIDLKPASRGKIRSTVKQMYDYAVKLEIVNKNYAVGLEINEKTEKTGAIFTDAEIATLWKHSDDEIAQQLLVMIYTGMRVGEMLALHKDTMYLDKSYMIGGNKSEAGIDRVIPLHAKIAPFVVKLLGENDYLLQNPDTGKPYSYNAMREKYKTFFEKHGMEHKAHDCRKTAVSLMHTAGIPMESIRIIVGHSGKGVTEKVYLYKNAEELVDIVNKIEIPYC